MTDPHNPRPHVQLAVTAAEHCAAYCATFASGSGMLLDQHFEADAVLVPRPGHPVRGAQSRVVAHDHLLGFGVPIQAQARHVYVADDIALLIVDWSIQGTSRQGYPIDLRGAGADVARRGADGHWRYVIDNPFGTA